MVDRPRQRSRPPDARSSLIEYGGVAALLGAVVIVGTVLRRVLEHLARIPPTTEPIIGAASAFTGRILLAFGYAVLVLGVIGVGYLLARAKVERLDRIDGPDLFTISGTIAAAAFVLVYVAAGWIQRSVVPLVADLVGPVTTVVLALGYVRYRDVSLRTPVPDSDLLPTVLGVGLVAVLAGGSVLLGSGTGRTAVFGSFFQPRIGPAGVLRSVVVTGILGGVGYALLYNAAIQGRLGIVTRPAKAVAAVTVLPPVRAWAGIELQLLTAARQGSMVPTPLVQSLGLAIGAIVVGVVAAWLFARSVGFAQSWMDGTVTTLRSGVAVAGIVSIAILLVGVVRGYPDGVVLGIVTVTVVAATAAIGYERTRSVWVPALAFGVYLLLVDSALTRPLLAVIH